MARKPKTFNNYWIVVAGAKVYYWTINVKKKWAISDFLSRGGKEYETWEKAQRSGYECVKVDINITFK